MNFLVHLFVSAHDEYLQIGNWMGDLIKNRHISDLPPGIRKGVLHHRYIDEFSDQHQIIKRGVSRLRDKQRRYSPVVVDVFYDFLLFHNWDKYSPNGFQSFTDEFYAKLTRWQPVYPEYIQPRAASMARYRFLDSYTSEGGMKDVYKRLSERARFKNRMALAFEDLSEYWAAFNDDFNAFFPELIKFADEKAKELGM